MANTHEQSLNSIAESLKEHNRLMDKLILTLTNVVVKPTVGKEVGEKSRRKIGKNVKTKGIINKRGCELTETEKAFKPKKKSCTAGRDLYVYFRKLYYRYMGVSYAGSFGADIKMLDDYEKGGEKYGEPRLGTETVKKLIDLYFLFPQDQWGTEQGIPTGLKDFFRRKDFLNDKLPDHAAIIKRAANKV